MTKKWTSKDLVGKKGIRGIEDRFSKEPLSGNKVRLVFHEKIRGMNGPDGLIREHWSKAMKKKEILQWLIRQQTNIRIKGKVSLTYRKHAVRLMDWDNYVSSFKHIGDSLVKCMVIEDDKPEIIHSFIPDQVKVKHFSDEFIEVIIESVN